MTCNLHSSLEAAKEAMEKLSTETKEYFERQTELINKAFIQKYTGYPINILEFKRDKEKLHPTQKPVALFEYLIKTYTNEDETVLDNCMGSGTTAIACMNTDRQYIGFELDKDYYDIAQDRIKKHTQQFTRKEK